MLNWCNKIPQRLITKLYNQTALGIYDDELVDEVGYWLFSRCKSIISVTIAYEKELLLCPNRCDIDIPLINDVFCCPCGFKATWDDFRKSYKGKQLYAANALPIFIAYHKNFPKAKTYGEKLICIDILIHSFHIKNSYHNSIKNYDIENEDTILNRPTGANLIEGTLKEVVMFLDKLSALPNSSEKERWAKNIGRANGGNVL